jgi:hypothetical protein
MMIFSTVLLFALLSQVQAHKVTTYSTRAAWNAAIGPGTIVKEDFNSLGDYNPPDDPGYIKLPATFLIDGVEVETDNGKLYAVQANKGQTIDNSTYLYTLLSDDDGTKVEVRPGGNMTAFGFYYYIEIAATLKMQVDDDDDYNYVGDDSDELYVRLTAGSVQFLGVTISANGTEKIKLEGEGDTDLALSFDNVVYVVKNELGYYDDNGDDYDDNGDDYDDNGDDNGDDHGGDDGDDYDDNGDDHGGDDGDDYEDHGDDYEDHGDDNGEDHDAVDDDDDDDGSSSGCMFCFAGAKDN